MGEYLTKFSVGDSVYNPRFNAGEMIIRAIYIDAHQIQYLCRPIDSEKEARYDFEYELEVYTADSKQDIPITQ